MDLDRIAQRQDRSATFELIRELADPEVAETERWQVVYALAQAADPRAVESLGEIGRDRDRPVEVRRAALSALEDSEMFPEHAELRAWWETGDDVVRASVLRQAARTEADLIEPVARDPEHPLHREALVGIGLTFEEPRWQLYKVAGLDHPSPAVRRTAAYQLGWDEPVAAESALHRAATDSNAEVACAAIDSLRYYQTRATLRLLHEIARGDDTPADAAREAAAALASDFEDQRAQLTDWLTPVADLLGDPEPEPAPTPHQPAAHRRQPTTPQAAEIIALFSDPGGQWQPKFAALHSHPRSDHWSDIPAPDRPGLAAFLSSHPDPQVRSLCCGALATWRRVDALLALAHDPTRASANPPSTTSNSFHGPPKSPRSHGI
ncbi:HEAT repeat domain-containing protein [Nocardia sp. NPDC004722]